MSIRIVRKEADEAITLDASPVQSYDHRVKVTEQPIEDRAAVTDHARREPVSFEVEGIVSESPRVESPGAQPTGKERLRIVTEFFKRAAGELLRVETDQGPDYDDVLLTQFPYEVDLWRRREFKLGFRKAELARGETTQIPPTAPPPEKRAGVPEERDVGRQAKSSKSSSSTTGYCAPTASRQRSSRLSSQSNSEPTDEQQDQGKTYAVQLADGGMF